MNRSSANDNVSGAAGSAMLDAPLPSGQPNRARAWMSALLGVVIFCAGLVSGAAATRLVPDSRRSMNWGDLLDRVAQRMKQDLDLTEAQQASVKRIVEAHQPELNRIRARTISEMRTELKQVIEETAAVLAPEQEARFRSEVQSRLDSSFPASSEPPDTQPANH